MTERRGAPVLSVAHLTVRFGGVLALDDVGFEVAEGEICALIGPNGAGKTTVFNAISRLVPTQAGTIAFRGSDLLASSPAALSRLGIARTYQNLALSRGMSVLDNVMIGLHAAGRVGFASSLVGVPGWREDKELRARSYAMLAFLGVEDAAFHLCQGLPFGTLKRVELARALVSQPSLLLLDEPASGLTHGDVRELGDLLRRLRDDLGLTILLVEHHMQLVMDVSDYVVALELGQNLVQGTPAEVQADPRLTEAYLGTPA